MGVYGMLALGLALFCLRYLVPARGLERAAAPFSFWATNLGLAWMCFANLFPLGVAPARRVGDQRLLRGPRAEVLQQPTPNGVLEWLRLPGDVVFIAGGVLPFAVDLLARRPTHGSSGSPCDEPEDVLFTDFSRRRAAIAATRPPRRGQMNPEVRPGRGLRGLSLLGAARALLDAAVGARPSLTDAPTGTAPPGFAYHDPQHDPWVCPRDEWLWPPEFDPDRRIVRYRARPSVCNACPVKADCTSSDRGREVVRPVDPWPHSEAGRFHRGLALHADDRRRPGPRRRGRPPSRFAGGRAPAAVLVAAAAAARWLAPTTCAHTRPASPSHSVHGLRLTTTAADGARASSRWASRNRDGWSHQWTPCRPPSS